MAPPSTPAGAKGKPGAAVASASAPPEASGPTTEELLKETLMGVARFFAIAFALFKSYAIRLYAVEVYGRVIHEFDPWFNFRATQYLADHGWTEFFHWCTPTRCGAATILKENSQG